MTTSSPQITCWPSSTDYSTSCVGTNRDTITITGLSSGDITLNSNYNTSATSYYTVPTLTTSQISALGTTTINTISSISTYSPGFGINLPEEWVNCFPEFSRIEKMCEEYPGLRIAFEKFKTTYKLVKDHYDTP
jgi:hypothetical protein